MAGRHRGVTLKIIRLGAAVLALAGMVAVDVLSLPMSAAVAGLLGAVVQRYLLAGESST